MNIQDDTRALLAEIGMKQKDFAALVGVHPIALSKFLRSKGCSIAERLVPYVYGDKRPTATPTTPPEPEPGKGGGDAA